MGNCATWRSFRRWSPFGKIGDLCGNHYADVLENPDASAELHNVIDDELEELARKAELHITSPEMLRLVYPLLRFRAAERFATKAATRQ